VKIKNVITRNSISLNGVKCKSNRVNLEWWDKKKNVGDYLSCVVYNWMLSQKGYDPEQQMNKTYHLLGIGSVIGLSSFDAIIWGSGLHTIGSINAVSHRKRIVKYDIRAVRGPITKDVMYENGYDVDKCVCGDPAILMPLIYNPNTEKKCYNYSVIHHLSSNENEMSSNGHIINIQTHDYKKVIDEIVESEKIISSSLHGIILAEAYGVPAVFYNERMNNELLKYYDWYFSTERMSVKVAGTIDEALSIDPMKLPYLEKMRYELMCSFPYDLWK